MMSSSCVLGGSQSSIGPPSLTHKKAATPSSLLVQYNHTPPRAFLRVGFNNPTTSISVTTATATATGVWSETGRRRRRRVGPLRCVSALTPELKTTLDTVVTSQKVVLFMKGTKDFPQCGFSHTVVQILKSLNVPFETINILENDMLRQGLKEYSSWPTFPQLYIDGEFFGGCDIAVEAYKSGELQELLEKSFCS